MIRLSIPVRQALARLTLPVLMAAAFVLMLLGKADTMLAERAADWRANGMTVDQFRAVFSALEAAGWRFTPARQRVFPALPVPGGGGGADGAVR